MPRRPRKRPRRRRNRAAMRSRQRATNGRLARSGVDAPDGSASGRRPTGAAPAPARHAPAPRPPSHAGQHHVDRVVDGDDAHQATLVIDDRHGQQVVARDDLRDLVLGCEHAHRDGLVEHDRLDLRRRARDDQVAQREHADQPPVVVGDVDVVDRLGVGLELAQPVDRLGGGEVCRHRDELGGHDPAGACPRGSRAAPGPRRPRPAP